MNLLRCLAVLSVGAVAAGCYGARSLQPPSMPTDAIRNEQVSYVRTAAVDIPTAYCLGSVDTRLAAFEIGQGSDMWTIFPDFGIAPEMQAATTNLVVIVYRGGWPGHTTGVPGAPRQTLGPGKVDVCVETADQSEAVAGAPFIVYGDVALAGSMVPH